MAGTTDVDGVLASLTPQEFDRWAAWDAVSPLDHDRRTLGLIGMWVATFTGQDLSSELDEKGTTLVNILMPWLPEQSAREQADAAVRAIGGKA